MKWSWCETQAYLLFCYNIVMESCCWSWWCEGVDGWYSVVIFVVVAVVSLLVLSVFFPFFALFCVCIELKSTKFWRNYERVRFFRDFPCIICKYVGECVCVRVCGFLHQQCVMMEHTYIIFFTCEHIYSQEIRRSALISAWSMKHAHTHPSLSFTHSFSKVANHVRDISLLQKPTCIHILCSCLLYSFILYTHHIYTK